ncbi:MULTISPECIES: mycothiol conjugate amidase Mca [Catellatospora]|uniref:Mycothiol S-conjugate amidase n=2 Tax=Catellatospora TaxID=53365 RepID=A0A8J3KMA0_9ACTN|nr:MULTISPECIES: mycothiol conjugate amidase Mca [Catellatospora]RKE08098.1 mycothiol S-conjugate amidase [Catellatospora citrea]GIF88580.1 mycothiol S-conjugate amidase [Catellatospora chokoriensis]GIF98479.1 mycothiol S-conjugate amidase [Catellatospora citrea]
MTQRLRLMAVHAHPDDESSKGAATMARYVREGAEVLVVTCTGGERGDVLNPKLDRPDVWENIAEIRRAEMAAARDILGVDQAWLGFVDSGWVEGYTHDDPSGLPEGCFARVPVEEAAAPLVKLIREFRPQVLLTYDEEGGYPHPDHIQTHLVSMAAIEAAADPARYPDFGPAFEVPKVYYHISFTKVKFTALHEAMEAAGLESPYGERLNDDWVGDKSPRITTRVPCGEYFELRDDALRAHATQIDPDGPWFRAPLTVQRAAWPTEDYQLVRSTVATAIPEDDLFAGVRAPAVADR